MENNLEQIDNGETKIFRLAKILEGVGYSNPDSLIRNEILPFAEKNKFSIKEALLKYANPDSDQDTSFYQLFSALTKISQSDLDFLN